MKGNVIPFIKNVDSWDDLNEGDYIPEKLLSSRLCKIMQEKGCYFVYKRSFKISEKDSRRIQEFAEASNELNKYWEEKENK